MPDYKLYDEIVAETLEHFMKHAADKRTIIINVKELRDLDNFFLELSKIAGELTGKKVYLRTTLFNYIKNRIKNPKLMKGIKFCINDNITEYLPIFPVKLQILKKFNLTSRIFNDIYEEYYK